MTSVALPRYSATRVGPDEFRVPGLTDERLRQALALLAAAEDTQGELATERRAELVRAMLVADIDLVPAATVAQAHRLARQREQLLALGAYPIESLAELRGDRSESATRTWLTRRRKEGRIFTVTHRGNTLVPRLQLDDHGEPRAELTPMITRLSHAGLAGWALWTWLAFPNAWLDGDVPAEEVRRDADRVLGAAEAYAANVLVE